MDEMVQKYLFDILTSIDSIDSYLTGNRVFAKYEANKMLRRAVEREMEIMGEAMTRICQIDPDIEISSKKQIMGMRNRVIHGYDKVDNVIVWGTVIRHLPVLKKEIEAIINQI